MSNEDELIKEHIGLIKHIVDQYADKSDEDKWNDLFSAALEGAAKALVSFDGSKGILGDHIARSAKNSIIDEWRKMVRWNKDERLAEDFEDAIEGDVLDPEAMLIRREELEKAKQIVGSIIYNLTKREVYILWNYIISDDPKTLRELAEYFQCSHVSIHRDAQRIKKLLEEAGDGTTN
jgi:RNA polymerase sigma factor (sigma-70 family)